MKMNRELERNKNIYLDNSATTQTDKEVIEAMIPYFSEYYGNPSSIYKIGRESKKAIEDSREKIANAINCNPEEIYFTSGGSESDNTILKGIAHNYKFKGNHIITSKIEHPAILETCKELEKEGYEITYLNVNENGTVDINQLINSIKSTTILISIMFANNEIGTIEPIKEIGKIAKNKNIFFHTDAVQAVGIEKIDVKEMNIDCLSMSAHKFYGPKGIGALYVKSGIKFKKLIEGGHQEKNKRAGTENVPGIVGMGKAIEIEYRDLENNRKRIKELRDYFISQIQSKIKDIKINGDLQERLPGNANISFEGISGESLLINLDEYGISASLGSACSSGSIDPSHVLLAIGLTSELAQSSLRITIGKNNTKDEIDYTIKCIETIVNKLRKKFELEK